MHAPAMRFTRSRYPNGRGCIRVELGAMFVGVIDEVETGGYLPGHARTPRSTFESAVSYLVGAYAARKRNEAKQAESALSVLRAQGRVVPPPKVSA